MILFCSFLQLRSQIGSEQTNVMEPEQYFVNDICQMSIRLYPESKLRCTTFNCDVNQIHSIPA